MYSFLIVLEMDGPYVRYDTNIVVPCVWIQQVSVGIVQGVIRNSIYAYILNDFGRTNIYVGVTGIMTRLHRHEGTFWFEIQSHENSKNLFHFIF